MIRTRLKVRFKQIVIMIRVTVRLQEMNVGLCTCEISAVAFYFHNSDVNQLNIYIDIHFGPL